MSLPGHIEAVLKVIFPDFYSGTPDGENFRLRDSQAPQVTFGDSLFLFYYL